MYTAEQAYRYENALKWIRMIAGMHYAGGAFEPEHMRAIANVASDALAEPHDRFGKDLPDYEEEMADAKVKAQKMAEDWGIELTGEDDLDDVEKKGEAEENR